MDLEKKTPADHIFKEAFCLMYYENKETGMGFSVWNSRNGVTPFNVFEDGKEYQHQHWWWDRPVRLEWQKEGFVKQFLKPGQRIFRDVTPEEAREFAIKRIAAFKGTEHEVEEGSEGYQQLLEDLTKSFGKPGEPHMVKVTIAGVMP